MIARSCTTGAAPGLRRPRRWVRASAFLAFAGLALFTSQDALAGSVAWQERSIGGPSPRCEYGFAYAADRDVAVIFGGSSNLSFTGVNRETWEWNGTVWTLVNTMGPSARCDQAQAFDSIRNRVVIFGGFNGAYLGDTWEWNGTTWSNVPGAGPSQRADSFMAFDSARGFMVLFGGQANTGLIQGDTWEYNGAWTQRVAAGPQPRWIQRMAYDSERGVTVMFGGAHPGGLLGDTWEWNGSTWTQINIPGPPARYGHAMAYDPDRQVTVLFGGQTGFDFGVNPLGDTWEYDGTSWTQVPITGPSPRTFVKMVYDANRRRMVLFGGFNGTQMVGDTWELVTPETEDIGALGSAPEQAALAQNVPNPFNPHTRIHYRLPSGGEARITVFDARGGSVRTLVDRPEAPGEHAVVWDGRDDAGRAVASGRYFYRLVAPGTEEERAMVLLR